MSTISEHIICTSIVFGAFNYIFHSNTSAVCDDGIEVQCVAPIPGCYIHKHQLCNSITDCKSGSDEERALCHRLTAQECKRSYHYNTSLKLPLAGLMMELRTVLVVLMRTSQNGTGTNIPRLPYMVGISVKMSTSVPQVVHSM